MRKAKQTHMGSDIYALIQQAHMSDAERRAATNALRHAEAIVGALLWVKRKIAAVGNFFLKPSLKH